MRLGLGTRHGVPAGVTTRPTFRVCGNDTPPLRTGRGASAGMWRPPSRLVVRSGPEGPEASEGQFNPFKRGKRGNEDAARKALEEAFEGKRDLLADFDTKIDDDVGGSGGSGGSGRGDGAGGGGGWFGSFGDAEEWKRNLASAWKQFSKWLASVGATLNAVLLFFSVFIILNLIGPAARLLFQLLKILLRLESPEDAFPAEKSAPAGTRRSVLFPDDEQNEDQDKGRGRGQELA